MSSGSSPEHPPVDSQDGQGKHKNPVHENLGDNPEPGPSTLYTAFDSHYNAASSKNLTRGRTGYTCDFSVQRHNNIWDLKHPECPQRLNAIYEKCRKLGLLDRCVEVDKSLRKDMEEKILNVHTRHHYTYLEKMRGMSMEVEAAKFDSIYFNRFTFDSACRAASCALNLVEWIATDKIMNGMALVRPPGHLAMAEGYKGHCFFNNAAIAAESVIRDNLAKKVLIVDIDIHHGQGTQQMFYDRKDVLYFSIHRYEYGTFWPNLKESNFNYIGKGDGLGYNINVPLNATGLEDADYLAIIFYILLPVAYEFNPELVIVSAGYNACFGDKKGEMNVTPGFYSHLISLLMVLARGKIAVVLEGGYFQDTLSEGVAMTLKTLLGGSCPQLEPIQNIHPLVEEVICNVRRVLLKYWNCFKVSELKEPNETASDDSEVHRYEISYFGVPDKPPFKTRCFPIFDKSRVLEDKYYEYLNHSLQEKYSAPIDGPVAFIYDESPGRPAFSSIMQVFEEFGLNKRLTHKAIDKTTSGAITLVDAIMGPFFRSGIAITRPPSHAERNQDIDYSILSNVAIAARRLMYYHGVKRLLIVDFDIEHGSGIQNLFYAMENVLYISIHKDEDGIFFPKLAHKNFTDGGYAMGEGYNVNIPFNKDEMGDTEYLAVFHNIILPIAYSYAPEVVLVSAGFDADINDPKGGYRISPETFGHLIIMLKSLAGGRLLVTLESGHNLKTTSYAMAFCAKALLGDPIIMPNNVYQSFSTEAIEMIRSVTEHFKRYYSILKVHKKLAVAPTLLRNIDQWVPEMYEVEVRKILDPEKVHDNDYVEEEMAQFSGPSWP